MKNIINFIFSKQFKFISLFAYQIYYLKKTQELGFKLVILLGFEVFATQSDFVIKDIAL